jgi:hypothetical protein
MKSIHFIPLKRHNDVWGSRLKQRRRWSSVVSVQQTLFVVERALSSDE